MGAWHFGVFSIADFYCENSIWDCWGCDWVMSVDVVGEHCGFCFCDWGGG